MCQYPHFAKQYENFTVGNKLSDEFTNVSSVEPSQEEKRKQDKVFRIKSVITISSEGDEKRIDYNKFFKVEVSCNSGEENCEENVEFIKKLSQFQDYEPDKGMNKSTNIVYVNKDTEEDESESDEDDTLWYVGNIFYSTEMYIRI